MGWVAIIVTSLFELPLLAPELRLHAWLCLKQQLGLLAIAPVVGLTVCCIESCDMDAHVLVRDAIAIESECLAIACARAVTARHRDSDRSANERD